MKTVYERVRELERDLEAQREWNVGLVRAIHDRLDAAGVSASHHSVGQRVQTLIEERDRLKYENAALRENNMLIAQRALMVPSPFLPPEDKAELDRLRKAVTKWQSKAERRKKHIELLNGTLANERERRKEAQKMARTLRARFEEFEEVILYHPHAPGTHTGTRQEWLKTRLIEKLRDLRWRPM